MIPIKSEREIEKMRTSCRVASVVLERVSALLRPGITTREVDQAAADFMAEEAVPKCVSRLSRFPRKYLHFSERGSRSRNWRLATNSVWRYCEARYRCD
jgi:hypothetical protein